MENKLVYIHYGDDTFRTPDPIQNSKYRNKPRGGLWASRKDAEYGWKDWCIAEEFRLDTFDRSFKFQLKDGARVLILSEKEQLDVLPNLNDFHSKNDPYADCCLDFEKLSRDWDAIELTNCWKFQWALYGWDCDSIIIMNPDIVEIMEEKVA